uniref:Uncharacterized protein n=1 Tax=Romanomermis culicivorax TaxID=13658 RepID=A0A915IIR4_ROMCU
MEKRLCAQSDNTPIKVMANAEWELPDIVFGIWNMEKRCLKQNPLQDQATRYNQIVNHHNNWYTNQSYSKCWMDQGPVYSHNLILGGLLTSQCPKGTFVQWVINSRKWKNYFTEKYQLPQQATSELIKSERKLDILKEGNKFFYGGRSDYGASKLVVPAVDTLKLVQQGQKTFVGLLVPLSAPVACPLCHQEYQASDTSKISVNRQITQHHRQQMNGNLFECHFCDFTSNANYAIKEVYGEPTCVRQENLFLDYQFLEMEELFIRQILERWIKTVPSEKELCDFLNGATTGKFRVFALSNGGDSRSVLKRARAAMRALQKHINLQFCLLSTGKMALKLLLKGKTYIFDQNSRQTAFQLVRKAINEAQYHELCQNFSNQGKVLQCVAVDKANNGFTKDGKYISFSSFKFIHRARLNLLPVNCNPSNPGRNPPVSSVLTQNPALLRPFADFRMGIATDDLPIFVEKVICLVGGNKDTSEKCLTNKNNTDKYHLNHLGTIELCKLLASRFFHVNNFFRNLCDSGRLAQIVNHHDQHDKLHRKDKPYTLFKQSTCLILSMGITADDLTCHYMEKCWMTFVQEENNFVSANIH